MGVEWVEWGARKQQRRALSGTRPGSGSRAAMAGGGTGEPDVEPQPESGPEPEHEKEPESELMPELQPEPEHEKEPEPKPIGAVLPPTEGGTGLSSSRDPGSGPAPPLPAASRPKAETALWLCITTWLHMTQFALTFSAETQLYFAATQGNYALQARAAGIVSTFKMLGAFLLNPIIAALSDAHGRKIMLFLPSFAVSRTSLAAIRAAFPEDPSDNLAGRICCSGWSSSRTCPSRAC